MTLDKSRQQAWGLLITAYDRVVRQINLELAEAGVLSFEWYDVLLALENVPEQRLKMGDLLETVIISRSGLTRMMDRMEEAQLLRRERSAADRRVTFVVLTDKGLAERQRTWPVYRELIARYFGAHLTDHETETIIGAMSKILEGMNSRTCGSG